MEIIVPISLTPLQKNVYKSILERNADVLKAIAEARRKKAKKANVSNLIGGGEKIPDKPMTNGTTGVRNEDAGESNGEATPNGHAGPPSVANKDSQTTLTA